MTRLVILLATLFLLASCGSKDKVPAGVLPPQKMQAVLWDVIKADAFTTNFIKKDSSKNSTAENLRLQQQIFAIHKTTKEDFYNSYSYYRQNTTTFKQIVDSMIAQADRNRTIKPQLNPQVKAYE